MEAAARSGSVAPRPPETVMTLGRLGSSHAHRLSFMRILLRRLHAEGWRVERPLFEIDARGRGRAVHVARGPHRAYSLVSFAKDLDPALRSDRVIATDWDAAFALHDGVPGADDIERLAAEVPLQEAGRVSSRELTLSRANRSVRLFEHVVGRLAQGRQPDPAMIGEVGYLMRTTAVYGSGKFGAADREAIQDRSELMAPFQAEMLTVWLIRAFVMDMVEAMAAARAPGRAVALDPALRRRFGIGNSTGLGMAPFLMTHPILLGRWIAAREEALARVRAQGVAEPSAVAAFRALVPRARALAAGWRSEHPAQVTKLAGLRADLDALAARLETFDLAAPRAWDALWRWGEGAMGPEGQEMLASLVMEPHGALVDDLAGEMAADEAAGFRIDGAMSVGALREALERAYGWALKVDWDAPQAQARVWYVSAEKLEPRLGERATEDVAPYEQPLAPGRDAARLHAALEGEPDGAALAGFLLRHPEHRHAVRRAQVAATRPYAEIRGNTIGADLLPIDLLRAKLSFFGATEFDPRSDRWVRIALFRDAPFPHELAGADPDDWAWPPDPSARA